ncbi:MAG: rod shape-determining protein MreD [Chloroflexia bacterium]
MTYIGAIILFIAALVQSVVLPQAVPLQARPQFVVLFIIAICLVESLYDAAIWAFMGGLLLDFMNAPMYPLGSNALILVLVALLASMGRVSPFHNRLILPLAMAFGCTLFYMMMSMALRFALGLDVAFLDNLLWVALPSAILNTILMPVVYSSMLWLSLKVGRRVPVEW